LMFMESTGARRGGVASLTLSDLALDEAEPLCRRAVVHEKGCRSRTVMMSASCLEAMKAWLAVRRSNTEYVFVDPRFEEDNNLTPGAINQIIARYQKRLGIKGRCSPHQWRHRFVRARLIEGMPLSIASQLAGHKSVTVTAMIYGNLLVDELQKSYDKFYQPPLLDE
jgi:integrase/recombinase XerD